MDHLKFHIDIHASKEKVWQVLWADDSYRKWAAVFHAGSYAESHWEEGAKVRFLGPDGNGMFSTIEKLTPADTMVFKHLGEVKDGVETETSLTGARESYYLSERDNITALDVGLDTVAEYKDYFSNTFPKALQIVKELAEQ
jgi:uncharacterized protein YndB with AHSA1/START domain